MQFQSLAMWTIRGEARNYYQEGWKIINLLTKSGITYFLGNTYIVLCNLEGDQYKPNLPNVWFTETTNGSNSWIL